MTEKEQIERMLRPVKIRFLHFDDYIDSYRILGFSLSNIRYSDVNYTATFVDCENPYATEAEYEKGETKN